MINNQSQYIGVDEIHQVHFSVHGNPEGKKVVFLHGGPGIGTSHADLQFFDLEKQAVILIDQRGCGKSTPKAELRNNTTQDLIEDIHKILTYLDIDKVHLFGGSWGSTLCLLFAINYPKLVDGMILRGLFTGTKAERKYFEDGEVEVELPQIWTRFKNMVPIEHQSNVVNYYYDKILNGNIEEQKLFAFEFSMYGLLLGSEKVELDGLTQKINDSDYLTRAIILSHYCVNRFFQSDSFIDENLHRLQHIPIKIIHGRSDKITLVKFAVEISSKLRGSKLVLVEGGHSPLDTNLKIELVKAVEEMLG